MLITEIGNKEIKVTLEEKGIHTTLTYDTEITISGRLNDIWVYINFNQLIIYDGVIMFYSNGTISFGIGLADMQDLEFTLSYDGKLSKSYNFK